jgi:putative ABC transport system permease protein
MLAEIVQRLGGDVVTGIAQAGGAAVLCLATAFVCRRFAVQVTRETVVSLVRGFVQIALVGMVLALLLGGDLLVSGAILLVMTAAAAGIASRRAAGIHNTLPLCFAAIGAGSGVVIGGMAAIGALSADLATLVPVGSMIIANAMNSCAQAIERFRADVTAHSGQVEAALALGAAPGATVSPFVRSAVYASLIPRLDSIKSLGIVWVPGMMAGMIVSGANPVYAGVYQFIVMAMIFAAASLTSLCITLLLRARAFSPAEQLILRPGGLGKRPMVPGKAATAR